MEKLMEFFFPRIFSISGITDAMTFIVALAVIFYHPKKWNVAAVLVLLLHLAGMYAVWLVCSSLLFLWVDADLLINYLPKFVVMVLYAVFFSDYKWQSRVILCASVFTFDHCIIEVGGCLTGVMSARVTHPASEPIRGALRFLTVAAAIPLRVFNIDRNRSIPVSAVAEVLIYSVIGIALAMLRSAFIPYFGAFEQTENYRYSLYAQLYVMITLICVIVLMFTCYFLLLRNIRTQEENLELSRKAMRLESSQTLIALNENNLKQLYKIKHEIGHRYSIMQVMLRNRQYDKLEEYLDEINGETVMPFSQVNTGNECFDMVFNLEIAKAAERKIEVVTKLMVPSEVPMSDGDVGGLIANLMDNAIEACEKIEDGMRLIDVTVQIVHSYLILRVSNTVSEERAGTALLLETDKPDKDLHGVGSKIIDDIVKKYDGQILRRVENNVFYVDIMLDMDCGGGSSVPGG